MLTIKSLNHDIEQLKNIDDFIKYINDDFFNIKIFFQSKTAKELNKEKFDLERLLFTLEDNKLISKNNNLIINEFLILLFNTFESIQFKSSIKILSLYLNLTDTNYQIKANIEFLNINNIKTDYHNCFNNVLSLLDQSTLHEESKKTLLLYFFIGMKNFTKINNNDLKQSFKSLFMNENNKYKILEDNQLKGIINQIKINDDFNHSIESLYNKSIGEFFRSINKKNDDIKPELSTQFIDVKKILLIDLDGTLTDTVHVQFKPMKDGKVETNLTNIPIFEGAKEFIEYQKSINNQVIIVSDSHHKYVKKIASEIFHVEYISLCDKPNINKIKKLIEENSQLRKKFIETKENFIFIGDTWLDIEVGRKLNIPTVLVEFYKTNITESRDGIGDRLKHIKMGATFYAKNFQMLNTIIKSPKDNLLALEGIFQNPSMNSMGAIPLQEYTNNSGHTHIVALGRQQQGECDVYSITKEYFNISNEYRSQNFIKSLALGIENYLKVFVEIQNYDIITFVTDKKTTKPKNKMKEIFNNIKIDIPNKVLFEWNETVKGSLRDRSNRDERKGFIREFLSVKSDINLDKKNIIIIDDQITTGATAEILINQLREKGVKDIIFIGLFLLISNVASEKKCPKCGKNLIIKIRRNDGNKFFSCVPAKYKGNGCGYTENIKNG